MNLKKVFSILTAGALGVAAVLGVIAYRTASAQESTPTAPSTIDPSTTVPGGKGFGRPGFDRDFGGGYSSEDLANALGITVEELNTAYQQANEAALDQAVQDGLITQAQADEIRARGATFPLGGRWAGWLSQNGIDYDALLADALGITPEELQAAYTQAFNARVDQAVTDGYLTQEQADLIKGRHALYNSESFQTATQSAFETAVSQAVTDGVITQAQADLILQSQDGMGFSGFGGHHGRGFGRHGGRGGGGIPPSDPGDPVTPESPVTPSNGL
jgi:hypothetical protein